MRRADRALLLMGTLACTLSTGAFAQGLDKPHVLDRVTISGSRSVPTEKLTAVLQEHPGQMVVQTDIVADRDAITKVLEQANVTGSVDARVTTTPKKHLIVEFTVHDKGIEAPTVVHVAPKLHAEIFEGNASIASDKLLAAAGLTPGEEMTSQKLAAAQKGIADAYTAAGLAVNATISGEPKVVSPGHVDIVWHVVETKLKAKKKRNTEDDREKLEE